MANNSDVWQIAVIPGHGAAVNPESIIPEACVHGFRASPSGRSRNDVFAMQNQSFASRY